MTSNKRIMGAAFTNRPVVAALAWAIAAVVCHASGSPWLCCRPSCCCCHTAIIMRMKDPAGA